MSQMALFSAAGMRDQTKARNYSPSRDEFRHEHEKRRAWGLQRRHAEKLRRIRERDSMPLSHDDREWLASLTPQPSPPPAAVTLTPTPAPMPGPAPTPSPAPAPAPTPSPAPTIAPPLRAAFAIKREPICVGSSGSIRTTAHHATLTTKRL
ncbi:hypothetical protein [Actinoplanes derwentensis]|uniref:hypothetical protein n=1 Tax=Actinoplanes derwentensis TaxID=113562 RepID=UPI0018D42CA9|nr:hypothetical protein [Actinoplanes derwentensis]